MNMPLLKRYKNVNEFINGNYVEVNNNGTFLCDTQGERIADITNTYPLKECESLVAEKLWVHLPVYVNDLKEGDVALVIFKGDDHCSIVSKHVIFVHTNADNTLALVSLTEKGFCRNGLKRNFSFEVLGLLGNAFDEDRITYGTGINRDKEL